MDRIFLFLNLHTVGSSGLNKYPHSTHTVFLPLNIHTVGSSVLHIFPHKRKGG